MVLIKSLRRHYPDQVIRVEGCSFLSARVAGLPTNYSIKLSIDRLQMIVKNPATLPAPPV